jgi:hypothetical protein
LPTEQLARTGMVQLFGDVLSLHDHSLLSSLSEFDDEPVKSAADDQ